VLVDALVDALVAAAGEDEPRLLRELASHRLGEGCTAGAGHDEMGSHL
jgi:hypothetical protein